MEILIIPVFASGASLPSFIEVSTLLIATPSLGLLAIVVYFIMNPEKVEKWSALLYKFLSKLGGLFGFARKKYIQYSIQYRINEFLKGLSRQIPEFNLKKFKINWFNTSDLSAQAFIANDEVVIHLNETETDSGNIAHSVYHFVSTSLLARAKRYITQSQRKSLDLFVTGDILKGKGLSVVDAFLEEYLHAELKGSKVKSYYDDYDTVNKSGHFYPILLNELNSIGAKIFGKNKNQRVHSEVDDLVKFLVAFSNRIVGEEMDLNFEKENSKFVIMIVGKSVKVLATPEVYLNFLTKEIIPKKYQHIYLIGAFENKELMDSIAAELVVSYEIITTKKFKNKQRFRDRPESVRDSYTIVLRNREQEINL